MRTAIYCRVSTPGQKNTTSLPEQERINRAKADSLGWQVSEPHVYREVEGGEDLYRPCMDRLWDAIIRHEVDGVVVDVLDRLSRDEGDVGAFYHHADRYGVRVELASEDIDESEHGRNLRTLMGMVGRMERVDIRRRTQRGRRARAAAGKIFPAHFPLYGYLFSDSTRAAYSVDAETAPVVVLIYERVADGVPIRRLCRELEARGIPTPGHVLDARGQLPAGRTTSGIWRPGTILRILHHPAYVGRYRIYRWQASTEKVRPVETGITRKVRRVRLRDEQDAACVLAPASTCPPLVSLELAARAHARLAITKADSAGHNPDPLATLWRGMIRCGHCGQRLHTANTAYTDHRKYICWRDHPDPQTGARVPCPGGRFSMSARTLDPAGWADVRAWVSDPENVRRLFADWEQDNASTADSLGSRMEAVNAQLTSLRAKMDALAETIAETSRGEARRTLQEKLDHYADQVAAEEKKRAKLSDETREAADHRQAQADFAAWVAAVAAGSAHYTREQQRDTLHALGAELRLWREDYVHPDGWPQRYQIVLHFTGFASDAAPVLLPPAQPRLLAADTAPSLLVSQTT